MSTLVRLANSLSAFWVLLAIPAGAMLIGWSNGTDAADLLHPSGETSARLMIAAMLIGPAMGIFGPRGWLRWLLRRRRVLGVAAFAYALLHLLFYIIDMGALDAMFDELGIASIWSGWLALLLMLPPALASSNAAMRALRRAWKPVQRLVYPAALLTLLHWWWVHNGLTAALIHFAPLALLWAALAARRGVTPSPSPLTQTGE